MKPSKKTKVPGPTVGAQYAIDQKGSGLMQQWFAAGWVLKPLRPDFHLDYLLEQSNGGELTGRMVYVQQKAHAKVEFRNGVATEQMERKHLRYYSEKVELPVFLVSIDTTTGTGSFLFLQEWVERNLPPEKLQGEGQRIVSVPQAQSIQDLPAFLTAFQKSLLHMKAKYPGSVLDAMGAEERRVAAMDPRFGVKLDVIGGTKHFHLQAKQDVTMTLKAAGENVRYLEDLVNYGKPLHAGAGMMIEGTPIFEMQGSPAKLAQLSIGPDKLREIQWTIRSEIDPDRFQLLLDGPITMGLRGILFRGQLKGGPLAVEIKLPHASAPDAGKAAVNLSWNYACWEGRPVLSLSHFDGVYRFVRTMLGGRVMHHHFSIEGTDIFPGTFSAPAAPELGPFEQFEFIGAARTVAKAIGVNPVLPNLPEVTQDDLMQVKKLAQIVSGTAYVRTGAKMRATITLGEITDPADLIRRIDDPDRYWRVTRPNQMTKLLGETVDLGTLEYTLAPAKVVLPPDIRARLEAGDKTGFSTEIVGDADALFSIRRVDPGTTAALADTP